MTFLLCCCGGRGGVVAVVVEMEGRIEINEGVQLDLGPHDVITF